MSANFLAAAVQMSSTLDKRANLATAERLVEQAAAAGARFVALPEMFNGLGGFEAMIAQAEPIPGPTSEAMAALAARLGMVLLAGSFCETTDEHGRAYNTSLLFGPDGTPLAAYRKIHLFDVDLPEGVHIQESAFIRPGTKTVCTPTPWGRIGQAICYDLRFPELFRQLSADGAELLALPSAFTYATGQHHWRVLLQSRAIENQAYVIAPNQFGAHTPKLVSYGHSMIVDPWGAVLAELGDAEEGVALAEIRLDFLHEIRTYLPALQHRRLAGE